MYINVMKQCKYISYIKFRCSIISKHTYVADYESFHKCFLLQLISALEYLNKSFLT